MPGILCFGWDVDGENLLLQVGLGCNLLGDLTAYT